MAQSGKLVYITPDGTKCKIGEDYTKASWFDIPDNVKEYITKIAKNTQVEFESVKDGDKSVLSFIKPVGGSSAPTGGTSALKKETASKPYTKNYSGGGTESTDRQNSIEKQAMMKTSAEVVSRLFAGQGDFSDEFMTKIWTEITKGYDVLMEKFNKS